MGRLSISALPQTAMMMMMVVVAVAAVPKPGGHLRHLLKANEKLSAPVEMVTLQLDATNLVPTQNMKPLENVSISPWTYKSGHARVAKMSPLCR